MDTVILGVRGLLAPVAIRSRSSLHPESTVLRTALRDLSEGLKLVLLDDGPMDDLEAWAQESGVAALADFRLWTERLGGQARSPSRLPFRFVTRRLDVAPDSSLYIGWDSGTLEAARRSGCRTWDVREPADASIPDYVVGTIQWIYGQVTPGQA
jgi:FMN phosphatase YigB (HAD superfamily)